MFTVGKTYSLTTIKNKTYKFIVTNKDPKFDPKVIGDLSYVDVEWVDKSPNNKCPKDGWCLQFGNIRPQVCWLIDEIGRAHV